MTQTIYPMKQSHQWILSKLPDYPYDLFVDDTEHGYVCLIDTCGKIFSTYEEYLGHYLYNNPHFNFIKRNLMRFDPRNEDDLGEALVWDPLEKEQIEWKIANHPDYKALRENRDATYLLDTKIKFAVKHKRNIICVAIGVPGAGKSYAIIALATYTSALFAEDLNRTTSVNLRFTQAEILDIASEHQKGDSHIQDEDPRGFGSGQRTNIEAFENYQKIIRKKNSNLWIVSPLEPDVKNVSFILEFFAYYPKSRIAKGILYTRKKLPLGYIYVEILSNEDYVEYEKAKDAFLEMMLKSKMFGVKNYSDERIQKDKNDFLNYCITNDPNMSKTRVFRSAYVKVKGDIKYQEYIAEEVYALLQDYQGSDTSTKKEKGSVGLGKRKFDWKFVEMIEDPGIGNVILEHSHPSTHHQELGKAWFKYYFCTANAKGQQSADFINEEFEESYTKVAYYNTFFPKFTGDQECFGKAVERAIHERYYPDYLHDGRTGQPDLIGEDDFFEIKMRKKGTTRDILGYFKEDSYIWELLTGEKPVFLLELVYAPKQEFVLNVYRLFLSKEERSDESEK